MTLHDSSTVRFRLLTEAAEAERCWHIYRNPAAVDRPVAAWAMLPLGRTVKDTLFKLLAMPIEYDAPPDLHAFHMALLTERRAAAYEALRARSISKGVPIDVH